MIKTMIKNSRELRGFLSKDIYRRICYNAYKQRCCAFLRIFINASKINKLGLGKNTQLHKL